MEPQNQPNPAPATPPPVMPNPVYSAPATTTAASTGGGLMSIILGVVAVGVVAGGAWWWMGNDGVTGPDTNGNNTYTNPFGTPDDGSSPGSSPGSSSGNPSGTSGTSGGITQNTGGTANNSVGAQSCTSAFSSDVTTRDYYGASGAPEGVVHGTFKPTSSVSSKFASSVQIHSGLRVVSKFFPEAGSQWSGADLYIFCPSNLASIISFYNSYFSNKNNWAGFTKMTTAGQGEVRESWAAISKTNPVGLYFSVSSPNSFVNEPMVTMIASYTQQ